MKKTAKKVKEEEFKQCPFCSEDVKKNAKKCEHCGDEFDDELQEVKLEEEPITNDKKEDKEVEISDEIQTNDNEKYSLKKCPYCQEEIHIDAIKCKHCREEVGKGYVINEDGTCVANKIQGARTSVKKTKPLHFFEKVFFGTIIVILTAYFVFYIALSW